MNETIESIAGLLFEDTAFRRLESAGLIRSYWSTSADRRYHLGTKAGMKRRMWYESNH